MPPIISIMNFITPHKVFIQHLPHPTLASRQIELYVLRLDLIHPVVSGNKWFKLQIPLQKAIDAKTDTIATFGGAYSNHIIATAFACNAAGIKSVGVIRGERVSNLSQTLQQAESLGMQLLFIGREAYRNKAAIQQHYNDQHWHWVNEGGYSVEGAEGAKTISQWIDNSFTHVVCATGTGTTMAGLIKGVALHQTITGISVLKGHHSLRNEISALLSNTEQQHSFELIDHYHFGGYAKHPPGLITWMQELWQLYQLPTDIIYTSKLLYGVFDLVQQGHYPKNSKIMVIHSGGLQGNSSLLPGVLPF